jgi:hypothetical protein
MATMSMAFVRGGVIQRLGETRAAGLARHAQRLAEHDALRAGVSVADATHLLWAITGFEFFDQFYTGQALSMDMVADLMVAAAPRGPKSRTLRPRRRR